MNAADHQQLRDRIAALEAENAALRGAPEHRWWSILEGTGVAQYELDLETGEGPWSRTAFAILGADPPADLRGDFALWARALHPEDAEATLAAHAEGAASGGAWRREFRIRRLDTGEMRWLSAYAKFTRQDDRLISTGLAIDVTDQKRAEAALKESESRLRALTSNFPAGAVYQMAASPEGDRRFLYVSESVEQFGGLTAAELMADPSLAYRQLDAESIERVMAAEAASMREHCVFDEEVRFTRRDGARRWARIVSRPRLQADGSWVWDGIQLDITEQKEAEQRLRELNATLEERVAARAAELAEAHEALRQSQKLESMGQLTGGVAHDFNNLLTPIIGGLDLLQRRAVGDERTQRVVAGALQSAERARVLVQRLLAFARRQPLQPQAVDLGVLIEGMQGLLASSLDPRTRLEVRVPPSLPAARADPHQLELALLNLALNARDAMPEGGVLTVSAERRDELLVLCVADTGVGMDAETIARAVEPFFSTKGIGRGTGLGLSMVHGLVAQLGGALHLDSAPGEGTRVELRLPVAQDQVAPVAAAAATPARGHGLALLVDDEDLVRATTADLLQDLGFTVVEAASGEAALDWLQDGSRPDLMLTDHLMPGMTGTALVAAVRATYPDLPVLIVSGYAEEDGIASNLPRLVKPFRREELEAALRTVAPLDAG